MILCWPSTPASVGFAYGFAAELFLVGLFMVSTVRFPSVKKLKFHGPSFVWSLVAFLLLLCLLIIFKSHFFLPFFGTYTILALLLNLAWLLGWRGIQPPAPTVLHEEDTTIH